MKYIIALLICGISLKTVAQKDDLPPKLISFEKDLRAEMLDLTNWGQDEKLYQLSDSEAKEPSVIINEFVANYIELPVISATQTLVYSYNMVYKRVHLNEDKAVEGYNKIYIPVKSKSSLVDLRARSFSASGKMSKEFNESDMKTIEEKGSTYLILALEGAEKGGEIEYYFIVRKSVSEYSDVTIQGANFIRNYKYTMRVPKQIDYQFKAYNGCPDMVSETLGDYNIYSLNIKNVTELNKESMQYYNAELMRFEYILAYTKSNGKVRLNTFADYSKRVFNNIMDDKDKAKKDITKLSKKLKLEELPNDEKKIRTIENWIKTNIVYYSEARYTSMKELLSNKFASELGLLKLYIFLFEENKIKYEIWSTCDRSDKVFDEKFESMNFLVENYFYMPSVKKFIDLKNLVWRLGFPANAMLGQNAVQIKVIDLGDDLVTSKYTIGKAEIPNCNTTNEIFDIDIKLDPSMQKVISKLHIEEVGYQNYIKGVYVTEDDEAKRKEAVEEHVKRYCEDAKITKVDLKNTDINDLDGVEKPMILDADFTSTKILENAGDNIIVKIGSVIGEQSELYNAKPRQTKIVNYYPHKYTRTISLNIPDGYTVKGLEKINISKSCTNKNGLVTDSAGFVSKYTLQNNKLNITCIEFYECLQWPVEKYKEYSEVINSAADFNKISIILEKKK